MKARTILQGCGAALLFIFPYLYIGGELSQYHLDLYHGLFPTRVVWARLVDLGLTSAVAILFFRYLETKGRQSYLLSWFWTLVPAKVVSLLVFITGLFSEQSSSSNGTRAVFGIVFAAAVALRWLRPPAYEAMARGSSFVLRATGFCAVWIACELTFFALRTSPPPAPVRMAEMRSPPADSQTRIVWLLFDELSFNQTFAHRYPGLTMPAFEKLQAQSVWFEHLDPAGYFTDRVIPSFFVGQFVDQIRSDLDGNLFLRFPGQAGWHRFDSQATLFADARRSGWTTGVAGWYNPYCRILVGTLDFCYSRIGSEIPGGLRPQDSILEDALAPIASTMRSLEHRPNIITEQHESDLKAILPQAQALIRDEKYRLIFIHLPVPHLPGIYDRKTGQIRPGGTYIDNLALADRLLGELMTSLNTTASASKTTLIVCSDHSWRIPIWRVGPGWTEEEELASQAKFDTRPVLMIHFPAQSSEVRVTQRFNEIKIHDIILRMLQSELNSPAEMQGWLRENALYAGTTTPEHSPSPIPANPARSQ
jgi:Sulfatase